jgi:hypothetical protein
MANRRFTQFFYSLLHKPVSIVGVASLSAAGAVSSQDIPGGTLTKTGAGAYLLTLADKYSNIKSFQVQLGETAQDLQAVPGAANTSAKTYVINTKTEGVNADASATAKLYVHLVLSNSSLD